MKSLFVPKDSGSDSGSQSIDRTVELPANQSRDSMLIRGSCKMVVPRRDFLVVAMASTAALASPRWVHATGPSTSSRAESVAGELFETLSESQRSSVVRDFQDPLRSVVQANWHVVKPIIGSSFYSPKQQGLAKQIVRELTSADGYERIVKQTEDDDGGLDAYSMAWFGKPGDTQFEWVLTGRHLTMRADGNSLANVAFGGPIAYGHGEESDPKENLFYFQTQKVHRVFEALDAKQRATALVSGDGQSESKVTVGLNSRPYLGLSVSEMSGDQRTVFEEALASILSPYREEDRSEALDLLNQKPDGINRLQIAFFRDSDLKHDGIWDCWRIEGPKAVIHFRGAPHVHAFIHIV